MKKVAYMVMLGKQYKINEPQYFNKEWKLKCFTDQDVTSKNWEIIKLDGGENPRKKSREVKIANHRFFDSDICLYLDARFTIQTDLNAMVKRYLRNDVAVMSRKRRIRDHKEEIDLCIKLKLDKEKVLLKQYNQYKQDGFPENAMLYSPGIMMKRNTKETRRFMEYWYDEVRRHSHRDIVSFAYTLWKHTIEISVMPHRPTYKSFMNY
jgi:hypothetical protein